MEELAVGSGRRAATARVPTFVSLYSGAGGLDIGFARAGFRPVFANDIDPDAVETYNKAFKRLRDQPPHLGQHEAVLGDIRAITELPGRGTADLVIGGPPCQGFSVAGRMDPNDPRSRHVFEFLAMVARVQPRGFVMENVKALAENRRWTTLLARLRASAESLGYSTQLYLLNASHFGVPQSRERMFLVGLRNGILDIPPPRAPKACSHRSRPARGSPGSPPQPPERRRCTS